MQTMTLIVEITGNNRSGVSGKGSPYCMFEAFVHLPNVPYPQKTSFYAKDVNEVPQAGTYECDVLADVRDGRLVFDCDPRQARRRSDLKAGSSVPPVSKVS